MTFAAVTLLGMTLGQPLGADYYPMNSRTIKLPIEYKKDRKSIRQVLLYVARNGENTWYQEGFVTPDKDSFVYVAKDDGIYWFKMVIEDLKGNKDPADLTATARPQDGHRPSPRFASPTPACSGDRVVVEWVDDRFPNDAETKVHFRTMTNRGTGRKSRSRRTANRREVPPAPQRRRHGEDHRGRVAGDRSKSPDFPRAGGRQPRLRRHRTAHRRPPVLPRR